ncbi:MAG TPA: FMN-binding glutamate synthase family protein [Clostridia bacterium]|nr:FMN-binding glutamate synthase family protein [Clostridia bacterium]
MTFSRVNSSAATLSKNRTEGSVSPFSGMCVTCIDGCVGMCEIGKSAYRGHEVIYPQPFGLITTASEKDYPVDYSHFSIMGTTVGAAGIEADSDKAIFPAVNLERRIGRDKAIKLKLPFTIPGLGSTRIAGQNWEGLAGGAALAGIIVTVGENVCGMDPNAEIKDGKVVKSPDLMKRIKLFRDWQSDGYGEIVLQANIEDTKLGVHEYAIAELGVTAVELKWGQGAKDIGGEVKINNLERAQMLKRRGYIVLPDPENPAVIEHFKRGAFKEFERHSRVGMVEQESFVRRVEELRKAGAKHVFLKTGAYRPADLARAIKFSSVAGIDVLTVDGAGGGTGMSPWRMMNEWGIPSVYLHSLAYQMCRKLSEKGQYVPDIVFAGGFTMEDQIFKGLALGAPFVKCIGMARGPLAAAMVGKTIGKHIEEGQLPVYVERFGTTKEEIFVTAAELKSMLGPERFDELPTGAMGLYTYCERLAQGLRQLMCGSRKFSLDYIDRRDIVALTKEASEVSGITFVMDEDREEIERILEV